MKFWHFLYQSKNCFDTDYEKKKMKVENDPACFSVMQRDLIIDEFQDEACSEGLAGNCDFELISLRSSANCRWICS